MSHFRDPISRANLQPRAIHEPLVQSYPRRCDPFPSPLATAGTPPPNGTLELLPNPPPLSFSACIDILSARDTFYPLPKPNVSAGIGLEERRRIAVETVNEGARWWEREATLSRGAQQGDSRVSGRAPSVSPRVYASRTAAGRAKDGAVERRERGGLLGLRGRVDERRSERERERTSRSKSTGVKLHPGCRARETLSIFIPWGSVHRRYLRQRRRILRAIVTKTTTSKDNSTP